MAHQPLRVLNVVGARPNFMKIAPLMREYLRHTDAIAATLVHTGQHYDDDMSDVFFKELHIPQPEVYLGIGSGSHAVQTARIMTGFEEVLLKDHPDIVVVVGDVNSTMACTLVAAKLGIPVAHVEAGLRSFDRTMPEEINRIVTDSLAELLFTTSEDANINLAREGIPHNKIYFVGNTMIDSLLLLRPQFNIAETRAKYGVARNRYGYVTLHRPSNVDERRTLLGICIALDRIQERTTLVWSLHPRTRKRLEDHGLIGMVRKMKNLITTDPLSYLDSMSLMSSASIVLTDSGGIQEETTVLGIPCLTLRRNTERPITVVEGTNELVGNDPEVIVETAFRVLVSGGKTGRSPKLWDGRAAERIVGVLREKVSSSS